MGKTKAFVELGVGFLFILFVIGILMAVLGTEMAPIVWETESEIKLMVVQWTLIGLCFGWLSGGLVIGAYYKLTDKLKG